MQLLEVTEQQLLSRLETGDWVAIVGEAAALTEQEPLRERPVEIVMRARAAAGDRVGAIAAFDRYRTALDRAVGARPSAALRRLYYQVGRGADTVLESPRRYPTDGAPPSY